MPYPGCPPSRHRPKVYRIVRLESQLLAFCKLDSNPEYIAHEAGILERLADLGCVPALVCQTPNAIYTRYIEGKLLPEAIGSLGIRACIQAGWKILLITESIHKKGVVHSDLRPWNFIYGEDGQVYLIDFEYAYAYDQPDVLGLLKIHHGARLKTAFSDWTDACGCVAKVWQASSYRILRWGLAPVLLVLYLAMHLLYRMRHPVDTLRAIVSRSFRKPFPA